MDILGAVVTSITIAETIYRFIASLQPRSYTLKHHTYVTKELKFMTGVLSELSGLFSRRTQGRGNINALETVVLEQVNICQEYLLSLLNQVKDIPPQQAEY